LDSPNDWEPWIELAKTYATAQRIWEFINPENPQRIYLSEPVIPSLAAARQLLTAERTPASTESTQTLQPTPAVPGPSRPTRRRAGRAQEDDDEEPPAPPAPTVAPAVPPQSDPTDTEVEARLKIETIRYKHEYQSYLRREHALDEMPTIIQNSIRRRHHQHTYNCDSAYEMLVNLKRKVAPDDFAAQLDLRNQYKDLTKPPKQALETWVNRWEDIYHRGTRLNMPEVVTPNPHFDFLDAIQNVLPHFYVVNQDLVLKQARRDEVMDFIELLDLFRDAKRIHTAQQGGRLLGGQSAFATSLQGKELGNNQDEEPPEADQKPRGSRPAPKCLCGETHWFRQCPYVVSSIRTEDWTPDADIEAQFEAATDQQKYLMKQAVQQAAEQLSNEQNDQQDDQFHEPMKASFMIAPLPA